MKSKHVYGPVPSRRLGRSLGVDGLVFKTCTFDCTYCQLGHTTQHTLERREYVPTADIIAELEQKLAGPDRPDFVSFAGSGEPTLHAGLGRIIQAIKAMTDVPVAVFTNGSLLWMPEVQEDLARADLVVPSLDGGDAAMLQAVNRQVEGLAFERILEGLVSFRDVFAGQIWLEVMLLAGVNDNEEAIRAIAGHSLAIRPDRVQLNTVCRPPAESCARAVPPDRLARLQHFFQELVPCPVDIIAEHLEDMAHTSFRAGVREEDILALVERRPCTAAGVAAGLGIHTTEAIKHLDMLLAEDKVILQQQNGENYYFARTFCNSQEE